MSATAQLDAFHLRGAGVHPHCASIEFNNLLELVSETLDDGAELRDDGAARTAAAPEAGRAAGLSPAHEAFPPRRSVLGRIFSGSLPFTPLALFTHKWL
jgi:hypothetical protein